MKIAREEQPFSADWLKILSRPVQGCHNGGRDRPYKTIVPLPGPLGRPLQLHDLDCMNLLSLTKTGKTGKEEKWSRSDQLWCSSRAFTALSRLDLFEATFWAPQQFQSCLYSLELCHTSKPQSAFLRRLVLLS
ncbi:unnamed protein product [Caenorhabditis brenneri]